MIRKQYTAAFKAQMVQEMLKEDKTVGELATEYAVHPTQLRQWKKTALDGLPDLFADRGHEALTLLKAEHSHEVENLYAEIGRLTTQVRWLQKKSGIDTAAH